VWTSSVDKSQQQHDIKGHTPRVNDSSQVNNDRQ